MTQPRIVGIVGFGRFGQLLAKILQPDFQVRAHDLSESIKTEAKSIGVDLVDLPTALQAEVIFYCVPISAFQETFEQHLPIYSQATGSKLLIDVLSVKTHPKDVFDKSLPAHYQALLTHPMFGPDSVKLNGLSGQTIVVDRYRTDEETFRFWEYYFAGKKLKVVEMSADEHDRLAADSQGVTHFVGRVLGEFGFEPTSIDTLGAKKLYEIKSQVCNDTWQLFVDLQTYNPYTRAMRVLLSDAQDKVFNELLPNRIHKDRLVVGIQGGRGSFNEEAALYYLSRTPALDYELKYLHTTENVLRELHEGFVDRGQFAMHNSLGGIVRESVDAMSHYNCHIIEEFAIKISHALMIAPKADFNQVDTIMTHPQVLRQCRTNLDKKYQNLKLTSGEGELVDHAKVAELLAQGQIPPNVATMGSKVLAEIYGLQIVEEGLQDSQENFTSFLWVERPR
jgi:prephenate dehydrogenase